VPLYVWIALVIFVAGLVLGLVWCTIRFVAFWRHGRPALKRMLAEADAMQARTTALEQRMAMLEERRAALEREAGRLKIAVARARVLLGAVQDAKTLVDRVAVFFP
jgi:cell division protein FtsB